MKNLKLELDQKFLLTPAEACTYFNLGDKKVRTIAEEHMGDLAIRNGNRVLIIRKKFEKFLEETECV